MSLVGLRGTVIVGIDGPGSPGKVRVETGAGIRDVIAYSDEVIPCYAAVVVYDQRPGGVEVSKVQ